MQNLLRLIDILSFSIKFYMFTPHLPDKTSCSGLSSLFSLSPFYFLSFSINIRSTKGDCCWRPPASSHSICILVRIKKNDSNSFVYNEDLVLVTRTDLYTRMRTAAQEYMRLDVFVFVCVLACVFVVVRVCICISFCARACVVVFVCAGVCVC